MTETCLKTTTGVSIPLQGVRVDATVVGGHTRVTLRQVYKNLEAQSVEAVYVFPTPSNASVCGFAMEVNGRRIESDVREREQAHAMYDEAVQQGHGAALLERERDNVFTASVGNLLPGEETHIDITYVQPLTVDEGALRWMLPTGVAPRYIPGAPQGDRTGGGRIAPTDRVPDADRVTPPIGDVGYGLKLELVFDLGAELAVESPSHAITVQTQGTKSIVNLTLGEVALDRDIVVTARGAKGQIEGAIAHKTSSDAGYFALTVVPDFFDPARKPKASDVVFLIDISGSMEGQSLTEAKSALRLCLRHLREGDRFNVIAFESSQYPMHRRPVAFTQKSLAEADTWIDRLETKGGTELLAPLRDAVEMAPQGIVVLLTDGQVGNENEILDAVMRVRRSTQVYAFGIGTAVSDQLLRDLARRTAGGIELIHPGERIDEKVTATFARAFAERVSDVRVVFDNVRVDDVSPMHLPPLIDGEPWTLMGRYMQGGSGHVKLTGMRESGPFELRVPVTLEERAEQPSLPSLWATARVRDLLEAGSNRERVIDIAVKYKVASPFTSFVLVDEREGATQSSNGRTRFVPVNAPHGWAMRNTVDATFGGAGTGSYGRLSSPVPARPRAAAPAAPMPSMALREASKAAAPGVGSSGGFVGAVKELFKSKKSAAASASHFEPSADAQEESMDFMESAPSTPQDPIAALLLRQLASGLWPDAAKADTGDVEATVSALQTLRDAGVTTAHAVYGAQVRKAVEALVDALGADDTLARRALEVAWSVATGARTRARITAAAKHYPGLQLG